MRAESGLVPAAALDAVSVEARRRMWRRIVDDPDHPVCVLVAETAPRRTAPRLRRAQPRGRDLADGRTVGFAACAPLPDVQAVGEVHALYVAPACQRRGYGSTLLAAAESNLSDRGCREAIVWVLETNAAARAFYRSHGWPDDHAQRTEVMGGAEVVERRHRKRLRRSR